MDDDEREVIRAEGLDRDHPSVQIAIDLVRWELELRAPKDDGKPQGEQRP